MKILGGKHIVLPPPPNNFANLKKFIISNARIGWKSTVIHYKTIKFNIKIILNIHNSQFFGSATNRNVITARICWAEVFQFTTLIWLSFNFCQRCEFEHTKFSIFRRATAHSVMLHIRRRFVIFFFLTLYANPKNRSTPLVCTVTVCWCSVTSLSN